MAKLTKTTLFKETKPQAETLIDKISRAAMEIIDDETEQRQTKTDRLRKARLARDASAAEAAAKPASKKKSASKKPKTAKKS